MEVFIRGNVELIEFSNCHCPMQTCSKDTSLSLSLERRYQNSKSKIDLFLIYRVEYCVGNENMDDSGSPPNRFSTMLRPEGQLSRNFETTLICLKCDRVYQAMRWEIRRCLQSAAADREREYMPGEHVNHKLGSTISKSISLQREILIW